MKNTSRLAHLLAATVMPVVWIGTAGAQATTVQPSSQAEPPAPKTALAETTSNTAAAGEAQNAGETSQDIVVTGSSIRGAAPVGSPLQTVSRADIIATGANNTAELLRSVPALGAFNATGTAVGANQSAFTNLPLIHGIGVGNGGGSLTLVLLDGHRLPGAGINITAPDPAAIPTSALEGVDVIADGASSIYGSDAVAGVINFRLRRNFNGAETSGRFGFNGSYKTYNVSQLFGRKWDGGSLLLSYEFSGNTNLAASRRSYISDNLTSRGYGDQRSTVCSPANVTVGGQTFGLSAGGVASATLNRCEVNRDSDLYPQQTRHTGLIALRQFVAPSVELYGDVLYSQRLTKPLLGAQSSQQPSTGLSVSVPATSPFYVPIPGFAGQTQLVTYNPQRDTGSFENRIQTKTLNATGGVIVDIGSWKAQLEGNYGLERDDVRERGVNQAAALFAANAGTLNPYGFGGATSAAVIDAVRDYQIRYYGEQTLGQGLLKFDGPLFELPGGTVKAAAGIDVRYEKFDALNTNGATQSHAGFPASALVNTEFRAVSDRTIKSGYAEVYIPFVSSANAAPGVQRLTLSASVRYDHYSDVGGTTNPRVGLNYTPVKGLDLRGSFSTSFQAPSLADSGTAIDTRAIRFSDFTGSTNPNAYSVIIAGGNSALKSQSADNYNVGVDLKPVFAPGLSASVSYFRINYKNVISYPTFGPVTQPTNPAYAPYALLNPTLAQAIASTAGYRMDGVFDVTQQLPTAIYDLRRVNFGRQLIDGIDFNVDYKQETGIGTFVAGVVGTYLFTFQQFLDGGVENRLLGTNYAVKFKGRASLMWSRNDYTASLFLNHTAPYDNFNLTPTQRVQSWNTFDIHLGWDLPATGALSNLRLTFDANNVFDANPPFYYNGGDNLANARGYDPTVASALGRVVMFGVTKRW